MREYALASPLFSSFYIKHWSLVAAVAVAVAVAAAVAAAAAAAAVAAVLVFI